MSAVQKPADSAGAAQSASAGARPGVSIGLPVYNGARYLEEALDSLLGQSYTDFELIISDNASDDDTPRICVDYARRDSRIRYIRQPRNIGAPRNWSFVATVARGRYFKWASSNDLCAPEMLERCVATLEARQDAVLCYGRTCLMDEETGQRMQYDGDFSVEDALPSQRLEHLLREIRLNNAQCGVIRTEVLQQTRLDRPYPSGDMPLMAELVLRGAFVLLPETLLVRRMGRSTFSRNLVGQAYADFFGSRSISLVDSARRHIDHLVGIVRAPIDFQEKRRSLAWQARCLYWDIHGAWRSLRAPRSV